MRHLWASSVEAQPDGRYNQVCVARTEPDAACLRARGFFICVLSSCRPLGEQQAKLRCLRCASRLREPQFL
jgi:hypothetical protein